jgi:hypothetical protein
LSAPSAEGETKTHAGSIGAELLEWAEELFDIPTREPAALVLNLDVYALGAGADPERDGGPRPASIATPSSTGITVSLMPRAFASKVEADAISSMNPATRNCSRF